MSCFIVASALSCGLGNTLAECVDQLLLGQPKPGEFLYSELEDPVSAPYFSIASKSKLTTHELMYQTSVAVLTEVLEQSGLSKAERARTGVFWGSSSFTVSDSERLYFSELSSENKNALPMPIVGYNKLPEKLAKQFGLSSCVHSYATACTSSANALLYADAFIQNGDIDHAIVVGSEFQNAPTLLGFHGLELLSPSRSMLPFDECRDGLILGEGFGALLVSKEKTSGARYLGGACNTDTYSLTAANTDGSSIAAVISQSLKAASVNPQDIKGVKVHGTASLLNDEAESAGLKRVFDSEIPTSFALKPFIGHTLGACGVVELALCLGAFQQGSLPANPGVGGDAAYLGLALNQSIKKVEPGKYLMNYFAFGGNNTSLILEFGA